MVPVLASPPHGDTRAPQGAAASPMVWVLTPTPPCPAAGWEPRTEIPPVTAGPAPVTPGTRRSGYASRTRRQTRHSSGGTGARAPAAAPAMGTAVPCCRRQQHCPGLAAPQVLAGWILGGAGQPSGAGGPTSTVGQPRSTLGTPTHTAEGAPPGPAWPLSRDTTLTLRTSPRRGCGVPHPGSPRAPRTQRDFTTAAAHSGPGCF